MKTIFITFILLNILGFNSIKLNPGFVHPTEQKGYYVAQSFGNYSKRGVHLGVDITKRGAPNADLGEPVYAICDMTISSVNGNNKGYLSAIAKMDGKYYRIIYLHLDTIFVKEGWKVNCGRYIGTIGNDEGSTTAHLHLEITSDTTKYLGAYGALEFNESFMDPMKLIPKYKE
jgi:murein DD-endopeptidase MepM/ murein hydrolase activator NlpD